jgi:hypothetical protein
MPKQLSSILKHLFVLLLLNKYYAISNSVIALHVFLLLTLMFEVLKLN